MGCFLSVKSGRKMVKVKRAMKIYMGLIVALALLAGINVFLHRVISHLLCLNRDCQPPDLSLPL